jgi:hypothetical protein
MREEISRFGFLVRDKSLCHSLTPLTPQMSASRQESLADKNGAPVPIVVLFCKPQSVSALGCLQLSRERLSILTEEHS